MSHPLRVAVEAGGKRTFAVALDWPGLARSGGTEQEALARLVAYAPRYARVADAPELDAEMVPEVVERLAGGSGTDFGVPSAEAEADDRGLTPGEMERQRRLLLAAWAAFDRAAAAATGRELRVGPRGGGRDLAKMTHHVLEAEDAYLRQLGSRGPNLDGDLAARLEAVRESALAALDARSRGAEPAQPNQVRRRWSPRYYVRRSAWHALDHAWEIEDRVM